MFLINLRKMLRSMVFGSAIFAIVIGNPNYCNAMGVKAKGGSKELIDKAWIELNTKNYDHSIELSNQCLNLILTDAVEMHKKNLENNSIQKIQETMDRDIIFANWAVNDAGECLFLIGEAYRLKGNKEQAEVYYHRVINEFPEAIGGTSSRDVWSVKKAVKKIGTE